MQIAQINLPNFDNDGQSLASVHEALALDLCGIFGGFTSFEAQGAWSHSGKLYREPVTVYQIAYDPKMGSNEAPLIREIAQDFGKRAKQLAIFFVIDGEAEIIEFG